MPTIDIVMCTFNGGLYIDEQLASLLAQDHSDWRLWVSDDASTDDTLEKVHAFATANPDREITVFDGPAQGSAANFLTALSRPELAGMWVAFADQDDVWLPQKLSRATAALQDQPDAIYAARTYLSDVDLNLLKPQALHGRPYGFGNALVQNVLGGNTMMLSPSVTDLVRGSLPAALAARVPFHDWWIYQITSGANRPIIFDLEPCVYYRQHVGNVIGAGNDGANRFARFKMIRDRKYAGWIDHNLRALAGCKFLLSEHNTAMLEAFIDWRAQPPQRRVTPRTLGLYRQTAAGNAILRALARSGRV